MQPDLAEFAAAIETFRQAVGVPVVFLTPLELSYPEGTILDPETGRPYDPTIEATGEDEFVQVELTAIVVRAAASGTHAKDDVTNQPFGMIESGEAIVIVSRADWEKHELEAATRVATFSEELQISQATTDSVGGGDVYDRVLVRGRER